MTGFLLSLFSLTITGAFFTLLLTTRSRRRYCHSTPEFLALSFFLGAGFVSCQLLLYHLFGIGFSLPNLIIVPAVLSVPAILLYVLKRGRGEAWVPAFAGMTSGGMTSGWEWQVDTKGDKGGGERKWERVGPCTFFAG